MDAAEELRHFYKNLNERQWSDIRTDWVTPDVRLHFPGRGVEHTSWEGFVAALRARVESMDVRYEVDDVVQHGPFLVSFVTDTENLDGRRVTRSYCSVLRTDNGKVMESWTVPGSDPAPVDAGPGMDAVEELRRFYKYLNERQWSDPGGDLLAPDVRFHAPGIGVERTGSEEVMAGLRAHVESIDAHFQLDDVVQHGVFLVAFLTNTVNRDGRRVTWSQCVPYRMDNGKVVDIWSLPGSDPVPVDAG